MKKKRLKRKNPDNPQIRAYADAVRRGQNSQHVVPKGGGWAVKKSSAARASKLFDTQKEAITYGKTVAANNKSELFIHGRDGRIRERNSYGKDNFPPKG